MGVAAQRAMRRPAADRAPIARLDAARQAAPSLGLVRVKLMLQEDKDGGGAAERRVVRLHGVDFAGWT